jgi:Ribbon-helix-helix protein, copG family
MAMRRFQMMLDPELDAALERRAAAEGVSKAELLRRYARERLTPLPALREDPLWQLVGIDDRADDDGAAVDIDEVVYGGGGSR